MLKRPAFNMVKAISLEIRDLEKESDTIGNVAQIINGLPHNHLFFLRYFPLEPSTVSHPYSHSIVPGGLLVTS